MNDREAFRAWLDQALAEGSRTANGVPLIDVAHLDLKDAQAAALIVVLADIIEATCVVPIAVPTTHATAA